MRRLFTLLAGLCIVLAPNSAAALGPGAHSNKAPQRLSGKIQDSLGRPVAGADLSLQAASGKILAHARSDAQGRFSFDNVPAGTYAVTASKSDFKPAIKIAVVAPGKPAELTLAMQSQQALSLTVVAKSLDVARNSLSPQTGGSVYHFSRQSLADLPQGDNTPLNQVLLQAPGVAQDSFGQIHVRGEHGDLQYRLNGVQLPQGISSDFGQVYNPRLAQSINFLTGALPAQYGYQTAGVVDIHTRSGLSLTGGDIDMYGGQHTTLQPSFQLGGSTGGLDYYFTGEYLQNQLGVEPPTSGPSAYHDQTYQGQAFSYLSYFLTPTQRISLIAGTALNHFQIPDNPGQPQVFQLAGVPFYPSANLNENQFEQNYYGVLAWQGAIGTRLDYQLAAFSRYSTLSFYPDVEGDLIFNGAASQIFRSSWANGLQGDASYRLPGNHTLRAGFYFSGERAEIDNHEVVFPCCTATGQQLSDIPLAPIIDDHAITSWLYGLYLQDEWRPIERLTLSYGVRFDLYDGIVRAFQASPRVGLSYDLFPKTKIHAGYSRYFSPPPTELISAESVGKFANTTGAPASPFSTNPSPERSHYFDVGVLQELLPGLSVGIDSYFKLSTELIDEGQFGPAIIFSTFNYHRGRVYGTEFTSSYTHGNLTAYANFAYSVAQGIGVDSGQFNFAPDELAYIAGHYVFLDHDQTFTSSAGGSYRWRGFGFLLDGVYQSGLRDGFANTGNLPYYIQVNVGVTRDFVLPKAGAMQARLSVVNLFDRTYQIRSGSGIGVFAPQFGPRRAVYVGLKWELPFLKAPPSAAQMGH
ncbi:MAG TPA: TonB-dependent receptor [Candidatus Binataceae bacterium]|nr:TonB-dependent receptor [Candidatus Binataceae bacterium]